VLALERAKDNMDFVWSYALVRDALRSVDELDSLDGDCDSGRATALTECLWAAVAAAAGVPWHCRGDGVATPTWQSCWGICNGKEGQWRG
jgi:hypothetical protein